MKRATRAFLSSLFFIGWTSVVWAQVPDSETAPEVASETSAEVEKQTPLENSLATEPEPALPEAAPDSDDETLSGVSGSESSVSEEADRDPAQAQRGNQRNGQQNARRRQQTAPGATGRNRPGTGSVLRDRPRAGAPAASALIPADVPGMRVGPIAIKGNKKIELDAIIARLISKTGDPYTAEKVRQDVDALFRSGFFYDVRVDRAVSGVGDQSTAALTYTVVEKPSIAEINFIGNNEVETDDIKDATGIKAFEILNMNKVREASDKLQKLYEDKGYFLARITPKIDTIVEGESVRLNFEIQENDKVKVKRITFLGNRNIPDGRLKGVMQTQEGGFFSFISGSGAYKQDAFDRDIQVLSYAYFNEGYVQAKIDRPQVYVTPDKKGIYITIRVEEGERFKVGNVNFTGDLLFEREDLFNSVGIDGSGWYVHETVLKDMRTLQAKYGDLGYAYANIIPKAQYREADREVDLTFEIDKGNKVYFGRIAVAGNSRTRDKVVRRELRIREGELYNETRKRESMDNVRRLGFFDEVNFNTKTPADNADVMDIDIVVKERNTGTIQVGAGYSTYSNFIFNGQVNQINLFGRGQRLGISVDLSSNNSLFNLNFTEPYFLDTEWSVGVDGYVSRRELREYTETKKGGALRLGHPLAPFLNGFVRYKLDETEIALSEFGDPDLFPVPTTSNTNPPGNPNGLTSSGTFTLEYDKRNDRFQPTDGIFASGSLEYAGLGGDKRYTKGSFTARFYEKIFWEIVFRNNLTYGFIRANDPNAEPPYNELFLLGGANSLRGYDWFSVGKRRFSKQRYYCMTGNDTALGGAERAKQVCGDRRTILSDEEAKRRALVPFGGTEQLFYQAELEFPLISEAGIKGVFFYDIGVAENEIIASELRQDVGFGFRWFSPIGPLRFEWGFPLNRNPDLDERASTFQFAIGSPF